jgi:hypothetical protein
MINAAVVLRGKKQIDEIIKTYENLLIAKRGGSKDRETQGIKGRPEKKDHNDDQLRGYQHIGKPWILENALLHQEFSEQDHHPQI